MRQILAAIVIFFFFHTQAFSQADQVDAYLKEKIKKHHLPGVSVAVVSKGKVIYNKQYGLADLELSVPVTPVSRFKIASLTKPITAIAVMQLADNGKLSLDSTLRHYLPELPIAWGAVTVKQVLTHTSGIPDYLQSPDWSWRNSWRLDLTHKEFIDMVAKAPMTFKPGTGIKYSNTGYYLLGMLIEKVSGSSYGEYIDQHIFKPLQMNFTRRDNAEAIIPDRVSGYVLKDGQLKNAEFTSDTWAYSEGGIITTVSDLAKLDSALYTDKLLKRASMELLWTPALLNNGKKAIVGDNGSGKPNYYGLGWFIGYYKDHRIVLHGGDKPGFTSLFFRFRDDDLSVIILTNLSSAPLYQIAADIGDLYLTK